MMLQRPSLAIWADPLLTFLLLKALCVFLCVLGHIHLGKDLSFTIPLCTKYICGGMFVCTVLYRSQSS
ncbi:hypothetical protein LINPERHAP1_LOCUS2908 [Linum perenne]